MAQTYYPSLKLRRVLISTVKQIWVWKRKPDNRHLSLVQPQTTVYNIIIPPPQFVTQIIPPGTHQHLLDSIRKCRL